MKALSFGQSVSTLRVQKKQDVSNVAGSGRKAYQKF